jgi:diaminohydroxyphosphoribosylaminopyrimidine deaminase/5-amino-6-(5-phosphoribosylamino)uracil reductase
VELRSHQSGLDLSALLGELHAREMTNVLVEGGGRVLGAFLRDGLADEARVFVAPRLIGGEAAPGPLRHLGPASLGDLPKLAVHDIIPLGPDLCYNIGFH